MFSHIQARRYRALKAVEQPLERVQALVGPNASGKTTFLDVIAILQDLIRNRGDVRDTMLSRSSNFEKLVWQGIGEAVAGPFAFQLAVESPIPLQVIAKLADEFRTLSTARYEIEIGLNKHENAVEISHETLWLMSRKRPAQVQRDMFPDVPINSSSIVMAPGKGAKTILKKRQGGNDNYYPEGTKSYAPSFRLGPAKSALANVPADSASFPVSTWFRDMLDSGIQNVVLNSQTIRQPSPPGQGNRFQTDGSNLPWVIAELRKNRTRFSDWVEHVRTALEDVVDIDTIERPDDRHRYLVITYKGGAIVPSWLVSDGTLRLLALTITAYLEDLDGVFLVEEPENGIHPRAIETVIQSLSSIYDGQVLIATHSPVALNLLEPEQILCFAKDSSGATDIVSGKEHPALRRWKEGEPDLGTLFAAGVLS